MEDGKRENLGYFHTGDKMVKSHYKKAKYLQLVIPLPYVGLDS